MKKKVMEGIPHPIPRTVEEVFNDFRGRRGGLIKALTTGSFLLLISFFFQNFFWGLGLCSSVHGFKCIRLSSPLLSGFTLCV